jgi:hypothetical protein
MMIKNVDVDSGLVNGSRGVVIGFQQPVMVMGHEEEENTANHYVSKRMAWPLVRFVNG